MKVYRDPSSLIKKVREIKKQGYKIGLVPTMGFLHEGHMSLVRKARKDTDCVIVSIFVNPAQFGPGEDFKKYPRALKKDLVLCEKEGVDIIFAPESKKMYPRGYSTYVNVEKITDTLCGASRPGHFRGVSTVVAKFFNIITPDIAYFGRKDAQQAIVIKRMAEDLNMGVEIKVMPIVREKDGLAMSSRNVYLNRRERSEAQCIYKSLKSAKKLFNSGERDSKKIINKIKRVINSQPDTKIDYAAIVGTKDLRDIKKISGEALIAVAVKIGKTRLIDNIVLK
ncbi:MAG: pantoate--beta-alanine ligase [Candidatus Omnitrophica bacterium CG02_land_8_20_14_3_00__42_8]|nr:MAG: pantoate--beta-alanine ligase [Candidatus Omnitrophica bacterium CG02_land_8_20_14_3_00__42_8]